jgi:hypothetical protein
MKGVLIVIFIIVGLPVIMPLGIVIFWVRCARNFADDMTAWLDDKTEPVGVVENLSHNEYFRLMKEISNLMNDTNTRFNHDKF